MKDQFQTDYCRRKGLFLGISPVSSLPKYLLASAQLEQDASGFIPNIIII